MAAFDSPPVPSPGNGTPRQRDHAVISHHRLSQKEYPPDCPPLSVRWFYAVDVPKRKAFQKESKKKQPVPNKFVAFSQDDSKALEVAFQKLVEEQDEVSARRELEEGDLGRKADVLQASEEDGGIRVPVNEDYLYEVDVAARELSPVYWLGNTYEVRRGTWFFQDGSTLKPCDENLATQIEEGYLRLKPFRGKSGTSKSGDLKPESTDKPQQTWRLFGAHMNDFVVFVDPNSAWLLSDNFYGKVSSAVTQMITYGSHMGGWKLVRGYSEPSAKSDDKEVAMEKTKSSSSGPSKSRPTTPKNSNSGDKDPRLALDTDLKRRSLPAPKIPNFPSDSPVMSPIDAEINEVNQWTRRAVERKMSSFGLTEDAEVDMMEADMKGDYSQQGSSEQDREIDHLILVTHGIGQRLSMRVESVNFVHDVNTMRKTIKQVYGGSPSLQALNSDLNAPKKNPRIQVLPVCWRHLLELPDPSQAEGTIVSSYTPAALQEITPLTVPSVRNLISDLALDVLLYHAPIYQARIEKVVSAECNRIVAKFKARQKKPWRGKIHLVGHSLGSAIFWDILHPAPGKQSLLNFDVSSLFTIGSPLPMFLLLRPPPIIPEEAPKCQLFNIFHPSDPLAYRFEPLIARGAAKAKPQDIPYVKRTIFSDRGWSGEVQRGVAGWWRGVVSGVLQRGLGLDKDSDEPQKDSVSTPKKADQATLAGTKTAATPGNGEKIAPPLPPDVAEKLMQWNKTGRVDFAIQESAFDISFIASIASHLGYWADEDVAHFIAGQVLAGWDFERPRYERDLGEGF